jgi:hypothetical protein
VLPPAVDEDVTRSLRAYTKWTEIREARSTERRSLLSEPQPAKDWIALSPARVSKARFNPAQQVLIWTLFDEDGESLDCELAFDDYTGHVIARLEQLNPMQFQPGTLVIARLRPQLRQLAAEPLSLVYPAASARGSQVDCLYFDPASDPGRLSKLVERLKSIVGTEDVKPRARIDDLRMPAFFEELRQHLRRYAERGLAEDRAAQFREGARVWVDRATTLGLTVLKALAPVEPSPGAELLRLNYVCLQYERIMGGVIDEGDG